jgi:hypothetical protein
MLRLAPFGGFARDRRSMPGAETFRASADAYDRHVGRYGPDLASALGAFAGVQPVEAHLNYSDKGGTLPLVLAGRAAAHREIKIDVGMRRECGSRVIQRPDPTPAALTELYANAAALVHASNDEGFGLTILEATAAERPRVGCRGPHANQRGFRRHGVSAIAASGVTTRKLKLSSM